MSLTYPDLSYTNFPDEYSDTFEYMSDVTSDILDYIKQYQVYYQNGNITQAAQVLIEHPEINKCLLNAEKINRLIDSIKSIQRLYGTDIQSYIMNLVSYQGDYSASRKYTKYNVVTYMINSNKQFFMCTSLDCPLGTIPTDTDYWCMLTLQGEQGIAGLGLSFDGVWDSNTTYSLDSAVTYNNVLYASSVGENKGKTPSKTSSYWKQIFDLSIATNYDNSISGSSSTTMQNAIDELFNKSNIINILTNSLKTKLDNIQEGAQVNSITGVKGSNESTYRTGNVNITPANLGITVVNNTADENKSVNYATSAGNSNTVDGYHFQVSTMDLTPNVSSLASNVIYCVYK